MMSTFDGALLVRTVGLGGISSHPYCDLRPVAAFVCKILKLNPISRPKGCGGLAPVEGNGCNPTPPHAHKKFPRRDLLNIQVEFKCIQVARWSAQRRPRGGGLATAARALRRNPRPHAEILAKRIRQNFFLSTNRGRRAGGGRGVKSLQPSGLLPHGAARADFFLGADVLIIQTQSNNSNIRKIKHLPAVAWARDGKIEDLFSVGPFGQFRVLGKMSRNSGWGVGVGG